MLSIPRHRIGVVLLSLMLLGASFVSAQGSQQQNQDGLAFVITNLFAQTIVLDNSSHAAHFSADVGGLAALGASLNEALVTQLATVPVASSSGGFTYTFDSATGTFNRASESFGPLFAERAQTIGKGKWNLGFSFISSDYDKLDDLELGGQQIEFQLRHADVNGDGTNINPNDPNFHFEGDLIGVKTSVGVDTETTFIFLNYGVTNRFDLGLAIPFVSVDLSASSLLTIDRLATGNLSPFHVFFEADSLTDPSVPGFDASLPPRSQAFFSSADSASGLGDILLRFKYRFRDQGSWALAADLRLPTGDEEDLLGSGVTQSKVFLIGSTTWGEAFSPHLNVGYTFSSGSSDVVEDLPDEYNLTLGFDVAVHPRLTLAVDFIGRVLQDAKKAVSESQTFLFCRAFPNVDPNCGVGGNALSAQRNVVTFPEDDLTVVLGAAGLRFNPVGNLLISANVLVNLTDEGLQADGLVPAVSLDYSF